MSDILGKLKPTYCDNCNVDKSKCISTTKYCEADILNAYQQGRADERELIIKWCKEQSRILKSQADDYNSEECFGGYRAFEDMIRHLEIVRGGEND